ncbi:chitobiase/beta-hexosaminidase C-terminal domain-containing protein [Paenibacillus montanisoli]|uniref:GH29D-like beta-sandwich domain-containing protein n=1 Tax=Paenibacillus montanisoli TaxID=2081970 RepID=A0A328UA49_9BACL|nr:chitobiase/beta-hexosaminidase C-terminal domain-containing protein [Paenibacillus montanisoli]RAP77795.1 hypothetical protein DL346_04880 [Paenibacillus montanisoli]
MRPSKSKLSLLLIMISIMCFSSIVYAAPDPTTPVTPQQTTPPMNTRASKPVPTFPNGTTVTLGTKISLQTSTQGGKIHYTTDGADPTLSSSSGRIVAVEGEPGETFVIKAVTIKAGLQTSETAVLTYPISTKLAPPSANVPSGSTVKRGSSISIASRVPFANTEYTLDGSIPDFSTSRRDSSNILLKQVHGAVVTIKAVTHYGPFYKDDKKIEAFSDVATFTYTIDGTSPTPRANYPTGTMLANATIVELLDDGTFNEDYYYTTDGSIPTASSTKGRFIKVSGALGQKVTVKAISKNRGAGWIASPVSAFEYTIGTPVADPTAELIDELLTQTTATVRLHSDTPGASIHFRAFKDRPGFVYTSAEMIGTSGTFERQPYDQLYIEAYAEKEGRARSRTKIFYFNLPGQLEQPVADTASGTVVPNNGTMKLSSAEPGAAIHYTTDGSEPTRSSPIAVNGEVKMTGAPGTLFLVRAIAVKNGKMPSFVAAFEYILQQQVRPPTPSLPSGSAVVDGTRLQLQPQTLGSNVYFTTDGSTPTTDSLSGGSVVITGKPGSTFTVKALAVQDGKVDSGVAIFTYTLREP